MLLFATFIVSLAITMALIPPLMKVAGRLSFVDVPDERKVHSGVITRVGGIAMVIGAIIPILLWVPLSAEFQFLLWALLLLLVFGAWDDSSDLDYRMKFLGQFVAAILVVGFGGVRIDVMPLMGFDPVSVYFSVPFTIIFLVGATNAFNLSDGLDGLAAGVALLTLCGIALLANSADGSSVVMICFGVAGVIFGLLRFNTFPARVFMGDTGSQFLGFTVGVLAIMLTQKENPALNPVLPLFLLGLPIVDTVSVMSRRIINKRSPFSPDKTHIHHQMLDLGMAHYEAVTAIYLVQILYISFALILQYQSDLLAISVYVLLTAVMLVSIAVARQRGWKLRNRRITSMIGLLTKSPALVIWPVHIIQCGVVLYLITGVFLSGEVASDMGLGAIFLLAAMIARLAWSERLRFIPLRLLVFSAIAFAIYLIQTDEVVHTLMPEILNQVLLGSLVVLLLFAVRFSEKNTFQTTPTDILMIAMAGGVGLLSDQGLIDAKFAPMVLALVVLFYAAELLLKRMNSTWNCFTVGMLLTLAVIVVRYVA